MCGIYKFTNKINNKVYIGQSIDIDNRKKQHYARAFNCKSTEYNTKFHRALRKYGKDNFVFEVLESYENDPGVQYLNIREIFFIKQYKSCDDKYGYNISSGGKTIEVDGNIFSFDYCCSLSKLLTKEQVLDIQSLLLKGMNYDDILLLYPHISRSFLKNINYGNNFVREDLTYPLCTFDSINPNISRFTDEEKKQIQEEIIKGTMYNDIAKKYNIGISYIKSINNGKRWFNKDYTYPLCEKGCNPNRWSRKAKKLLMNSSLSFEEISKICHKDLKTIEKLNKGQINFDKKLIYPLRKEN